MDPASRKAINRLKARHPEEWRRQIKRLTIPYLPMPAPGVTQEHIRAQIASIAFWDFFGGRPVRHRWPHLDVYLDHPYVKLPVEVIVEGLIIVGYPQAWAIARMKAEKKQQKETSKCH